MSHMEEIRTGDRAWRLDVAREGNDTPVALTLQKIAKDLGSSPAKVAKSYARLAFGRGKISFSDFVKLRLFDEDFHRGAILDEYVGQRRNRDICVAVNYRHDWYGILANKIASQRYLSAFGLPTIPSKAVYISGFSTGSGSVLSCRSELDSFFRNPDSFPLFGKPLEGSQSLGSIALKMVSLSTNELIRSDGVRLPLGRLASEIDENYPEGYIFQSLIRPHPEMTALCGQKLACIRVLTAITEDGPQIIRAVLKIPAGLNVADNYWRSGNLLAHMNLRTGRIMRVTSGSGFETLNWTVHPDSGLKLTDFEYPAWAASLSVALEGAKLMRHIPLVGWDIASTTEGPVIVEMNETPDLFLVQFADRRGILDKKFDAFMALQARNSKAYEMFMRDRIGKL